MLDEDSVERFNLGRAWSVLLLGDYLTVLHQSIGVGVARCVDGLLHRGSNLKEVEVYLLVLGLQSHKDLRLCLVLKFTILLVVFVEEVCHGHCMDLGLYVDSELAVDGTPLTRSVFLQLEEPNLDGVVVADVDLMFREGEELN
jgi:hypothetical protein